MVLNANPSLLVFHNMVQTALVRLFVAIFSCLDVKTTILSHFLLYFLAMLYRKFTGFFQGAVKSVNSLVINQRS